MRLGMPPSQPPLSLPPPAVFVSGLLTARNGQEALALGCLVVLFSTLLSGYLVSRDDLPAVWSGLLWVSPIAHAFEALVVNEFGYVLCCVALYCTVGFCMSAVVAEVSLDMLGGIAHVLRQVFLISEEHDRLFSRFVLFLLPGHTGRYSSSPRR